MTKREPRAFMLPDDSQAWVRVPTAAASLRLAAADAGRWLRRLTRDPETRHRLISRLRTAQGRQELGYRGWGRFRARLWTTRSGFFPRTEAHDGFVTAWAGPLVSVVMTVHNQGSEILGAVQSVLDQTFADWELIVWDDGSTRQTTLQLLDELQAQEANDARLSIFSAPNQGVVKARNAGAGVARGAYLVFLDPDDQLQPTYLEKAVCALQSLPDRAVCAPWVRIVGHPEHEMWLTEPLTWPLIRQTNLLPVASVVSASAFRSVGGFRAAMSKGWEDWDLWVRLAAHGYTSVTLPEPLFIYRYSSIEGRDATSARQNEDELKRLIKDVKRISRRPLHVSAPVSIGPVLGSTSRNIPPGVAGTVVFFVPWVIRGGGADRFLLTLVDGLTRSGVTVVVIATEHEVPLNSEDATDTLMGLTPYVYSLPRFLHREDYGAFVTSILADLMEPVIFCMGSPYFYEYLADRSADFWNYPTIDILFNGVGHVARHATVRSRFTGVIAAYDRLAKELVERGIVASTPVVIPVGLPSLPEFHPSTPLQRHPAISRRPTIGWLGRFSPEKRPEWFLELARLLGDRVDCVMAGSGPLLQHCSRVARGLNNVEVLGFIDDPQSFFSRVDLIVITSETEGISVTAMEALQRGIPVVTTAVGGMPELIQDGWNGLLVEAESPADLSLSITRLLDDTDELAALMRRVSVERLPCRFRHDDMVDAYVGLVTGGVGTHGA